MYLFPFTMMESGTNFFVRGLTRTGSTTSMTSPRVSPFTSPPGTRKAFAWRKYWPISCGSGLHFTTVHELKNPAGARVPWLDSTRGIYRRDNLVVLKQTKMPAVIIEAGVIVNREEELIVSSPIQQTLIATAIAEALRKFCNPEENSSYRIVDVAPKDVLNIRSGPNADLSLVGAIPSGGRGVRMVGACSGPWCQIDYRGARGWVNRQFLAGEEASEK
jgi:hypothetical protein